MPHHKRKERMTSFDLISILFELKNIVVGARINNVYQTNSSTIILSLRRPSQMLIIEAGKRIHLTSYDIKKPRYPPPFCRAIRKHIRKGIIENVEGFGFERIIKIDIILGQKLYKLISEFFPRGNIILLDNQNKILHAQKYNRMRDREILIDKVFKHPPLSGINPLMMSLQDLEPLKKRSIEVVKFLAGYLSLGGLYAEEVLEYANIDKKTPSNSLKDDDIEKIYRSVNRLLSLEKQSQIVFDKEGKWVDVLPLSLLVYRDCKVKEYANFNEAADEFFTKLYSEKKIEYISKNTGLQIEEQNRILEQQKLRLQGLQKSVDENKNIGDIIYVHLCELQRLRQLILEEKETGKSWGQIVESIKRGQRDFLKTIDQSKGLFYVNIGGLTVSLSFRETIQKNAHRYYERSKKAKNKIQGLKKAMAGTEIRQINVRKEVYDTQNKHIMLKRRKKAWYEKFHWLHSSEGFLIVGGRDASTNEIIIKKHTEPNDMILHADVFGAPFVLIKTEGKNPSDQTIFEAAQTSASYSKAWHQSLNVIDVYLVKPDQVKKEAPSGEYLSRGMFMIYGQKKYIRNVPLCISIGLMEKNDQLVIIGGSPSAISSQTKYYVEIKPGRQKSGKLAKTIVSKIAKKAPEKMRKQILRLPISEIQIFIPAGGSDIAISK